MRLLAALLVLLAALGAAPNDTSAGPKAAASLPTSRTWEMFREACVDTFPSYKQIVHVLDRLGFDPARHFEPAPSTSTRRGFVRWRGETANVIFGGLDSSGSVNCMMTVWENPSPRNISDQQCEPREGAPQQTAETGAVESWETPGWLVTILDLSLGRGCESYILIATSKAS